MAIELVSIKGKKRGRIFQISSARTLLGRTEGDIQIPEKSISGRHALIELKHGILSIQDMDSRNGVFLNGEKISNASLKHGDIIQIGLKQMLLVDLEGEFRRKRLQKRITLVICLGLFLYLLYNIFT